MKNNKELTSRQKQAMDSRKRLVDAAIDLFNEYGYHGTSIQEICHRANLSVGVFYHYFPSKKAILDTSEHQKFSDLMTLISEQSQSMTHVEAVLELFRFLAQQQIAGSFELLCIAMTPQPSLEQHDDHVLEEFVVELVRSGQGSGEFVQHMPAETIAKDLMISARGFMFHWCESGGSFDFSPAQQAYLSHILAAYTTAPVAEPLVPASAAP